MNRTVLALAIATALAGCGSREEGASGIHQGYSDTADQYEVDGVVVSNVDVRAKLWNPRGKSEEQITARVEYLASVYDVVRTEAQQQRAAEAREKYGEYIVINAMLPASVGIGGFTAENFERAVRRNRDAGITMVTGTVYAFPADGETTILERIAASTEVVRGLGLEIGDRTEAIRRANAEGTMVVMFNSQGADYFIEEPELLEQVRELGLQSSNFVYNSDNALAGGGTAQASGVTDLGKTFIERANAVGIVVDCSHSSNQTCIDAASHSTRPVIMTHSNSYGLHPVSRNVTDEAILAIAASGGVICNTGVGLFLNEELDASPEEYAKHVVYTADLIGRDRTCFSTDYVHNIYEYLLGFVGNVDIYPPERGFGGPTSNMGPEHVWDVVGILEDQYGWSEQDIIGFLGENLMRVYEATW